MFYYIIAEPKSLTIWKLFIYKNALNELMKEHGVQQSFSLKWSKDKKKSVHDAKTHE